MMFAICSAPLQNIFITIQLKIAHEKIQANCTPTCFASIAFNDTDKG